MPRYADTLLADGERIALRSRQHWFATIVDFRVPWALLILSLILLLLNTQLPAGSGRDVVGYAILILLVVSLVWLGIRYWGWYAQDYLVTNRRVLKVEGILNKRSADSSLEKINDAVLEQNLFGRIFGYGDLDILTAADTAIDRYRMLADAPLFKRTMLDQKHLLEEEAYRVPSPPLRPMTAEVVSAAPVSTSAATSPRPREMSAEEITKALSDLVDLRDRGAISPEEYEAKKQDLLGRL
jgi:hypothetical protein